MVDAYMAAKSASRAPTTYDQNDRNDQRGALRSFPSFRSYSRRELHHVLAVLDSRCPDHIEHDRWRQAVEDGGRFLATWAVQAQALGWTARDLFGLHRPPAVSHPSYSRLSRYDETGLIWLLEGHEVTALTADTAAIRRPSGSVTVYRKHHKAALGPLGDSTDDFTRRQP
jgi:hypothetical protein